MGERHDDGRGRSHDDRRGWSRDQQDEDRRLARARRDDRTGDYEGGLAPDPQRTGDFDDRWRLDERYRGEDSSRLLGPRAASSDGSRDRFDRGGRDPARDDREPREVRMAYGVGRDGDRWPRADFQGPSGGSAGGWAARDVEGPSRGFRGSREPVRPSLDPRTDARDARGGFRPSEGYRADAWNGDRTARGFRSEDRGNHDFDRSSYGARTDGWSARDDDRTARSPAWDSRDDVRSAQGHAADAWRSQGSDRTERSFRPEDRPLDRPSGVHGSRWPEVGGLGLDGHVSSRLVGPGVHRGKGPKGYTRNYERVREQVNEALARHPEVDASDIEVKVEQGEVTLSGTVEDRAQKRLAEQIVEQVPGVDDVHNHLRITKSSTGQWSY